MHRTLKDFKHPSFLRDTGTDFNLEFRVDGYTLCTLELDDDVAHIHRLFDEDVLVDNLSGPNELLRILMWMYGIKFDELRWYAALMMPNLQDIACWSVN